MQISDGEEYLSRYFETGKEVVSYRDADELIDRIRYYLSHDGERLEIARAGYRRVLRDYRVSRLLQVAGRMIELGMQGRRQANDPRSQAPVLSVG
jgi:spore maturation protein CgeB